MAALGTLGVALALWAFVFEPASFRVRPARIAVDRWPSACDGLRIAVLADLHVGSPWQGLDSLGRVVAKVNAARPDVVLLAGDYVIHGVPGGSFVPPEAIAAVLAGLEAPAGVFAVLGNHDWWFDHLRVARALEAKGIPVLEDRSTAVSTGDCRLRLVGISDFWEGPHDVRRAMADVSPHERVLAFTHNPDLFPELPRGIVLTIAGHTHGGQVYLPGVGRPVVPSRFGERYAIGHVVEDGRHLYVSPGVGTSILPVRFLVPPEVTMLTVTSARGATRDGVP